MTVRVNKSSFNIREKLSELGRKFGLKGSELAAAETVQEARDLVSAGRKNLIINGDFRINQRSGTHTLISGYHLDRWKFQKDGLGEYAHSVTSSTDTPAGFSKSLRLEVTFGMVVKVQGGILIILRSQTFATSIVYVVENILLLVTGSATTLTQ